LEQVLDQDDVASVIDRIEQMLPNGVRHRQLRVRTLLLGMLICLTDCRAAHLTRVHQALCAMADDDRWRLGVLVSSNTGSHLLTYRQVERTVSLVIAVLNKDRPDGEPSELLQQLTDTLLEASIAERWKVSSRSLAVDWTDLETFSLPPSQRGGDCFDTEASWGHRKSNMPGRRDELFFGYYAQFATMVGDEGGDKVPELARRMLVTSCHVDPPPAFASVLESMAKDAIALGDVLCDSGYSHRVPANWAARIRLAGGELVMDLHSSDRGPQGTHFGAVIANGGLYCPSTPSALLSLGPLRKDASKEEMSTVDQMTAELDRYRLGRVTRDDPDGYRRVMCPAQLGKCRCPQRRESIKLPHDRPTVLDPPQNPPACCVQKTITVPADIASKTAQKHPYLTSAWRQSYKRRTAAERTNSTIKDPATTDVSRGWCRLAGLAPITVFVACALVVRNARVCDSFEARAADDKKRRAQGREPKTRRRRRRPLSDLVVAAAGSP
jgi:hypothetical protein